MIEGRDYPVDTKTALVSGVIAGTLGMVATWLVALSQDHIYQPRIDPFSFEIVAFVFLNFVAPVLVVGIPIALVLRHGLISPLAFFIFEFSYITEFTLNGGDTPGYLLALVVFAPYVTVIYLVVGTLEYVVRKRKVPFR